MAAELGPRGVPLFRLQERHGLGTRQMSLMDVNAVAPNLRPEWEQRRLVNERVLGSANRLVEKAGYGPLRFAEIPKILTVDAVNRSSDLHLVAVPIFPFEHSSDINHALQTKPASPIIDIYGTEPLQAMANGTLDVNTSGHYVFMNAQGADAALWKRLGLNGALDVSVDKVRKAIQEQGNFVLEERKLGEATIDIASLEEITIHNALYGADNPIYGITRTKVKGTNRYIVVTPEGYTSAKSSDTGIPIPLVIRLNQPDMTYLPPSVEKPAEPEPVAETALSATSDVVADPEVVEATPVVDVFVDSSRELPITPPHLKLSPPQRWRLRETQRRAQLASTSK